MDLEDRLRMFDETLKQKVIFCTRIAAIHQAEKDDIKLIKEQRKEVQERIKKKLKELEVDKK